MKYFFDHLDEVRQHIRNPIAAFFDFDLTLSPVALKPQDAFLPLETRNLLISLSQKIPIGIISGRSLEDITNRVNIPGISYAGNHGLEWSYRGHTYTMKIKDKNLERVKEVLQRMHDIYPADSLLEDKGLTIAFHYRMSQATISPFIEAELRAISAPEIFIRWSKKTFEIRTKIDWNKGDVCLWLLAQLNNRHMVPIYIGDDLTDEDVFQILPTGLTIRVGKNETSRAKYYIKDQHEVQDVLMFISENSNKFREDFRNS